MGVLAITHFSRLLEILEPDKIHVLVDGQIRETGSAELAVRLEEEGYQKFLKQVYVARSITRCIRVGRNN